MKTKRAIFGSSSRSWWRAVGTSLCAFLMLCPLSAEQCPACRNQSHTKDIGTCKVCGGMTQSGQFQLCMACSEKLRQCEWCRKPLDKANSAQPSAPKRERLKVRVMVLAADRGKPVQEEWIRKELQAMGAGTGIGVMNDWFDLADKPVKIHDSRHYGQSSVQLKDEGDNTFKVEIDGSDPGTVDLDRKAGSHRVVRQTLSSSVATLVLYLVFEVQEAQALP